MRYLLTALILVTLATALNGRAEPMNEPATQTATTKTAVFAGGCFWCMEPPFEKLDGVLQVISGYAGGHLANPTYKEVSSGSSGHYEVVQVTYNPQQVSYEQLLEVFWRNIDPLDAQGQFCDKGQQYTSVIFVADEVERAAAETAKAQVAQELKQEIATQILPAAPFYPAEDYHQDYAKKNPVRYKFYRWNCGRDQRLNQLWSTPNKN